RLLLVPQVRVQPHDLRAGVRDGLAQRRTEVLVHRCFVVRQHAAALHRYEAEGEVELDLRLDPAIRELRAAGARDVRLPALTATVRGELDQLAQGAPMPDRAADARALVVEQRDRDVPAAVLLAHETGGGDAYVLEECLVEGL